MQIKSRKPYSMHLTSYGIPLNSFLPSPPPLVTIRYRFHGYFSIIFLKTLRIFVYCIHLAVVLFPVVTCCSGRELESRITFVKPKKKYIYIYKRNKSVNTKNVVNAWFDNVILYAVRTPKMTVRLKSVYAFIFDRKLSTRLILLWKGIYRDHQRRHTFVGYT